MWRWPMFISVRVIQIERPWPIFYVKDSSAFLWLFLGDQVILVFMSKWENQILWKICRIPLFGMSSIERWTLDVTHWKNPCALFVLFSLAAGFSRLGPFELHDAITRYIQTFRIATVWKWSEPAVRSAPVSSAWKWRDIMTKRWGRALSR